MFKGKPKVTEGLTYGARLEHGEAYIGGGYTFVSTQEAPRTPGPTETHLSLRRVVPNGRRDPEVQIAVEVVQRYRSGANSRHMQGSLTLRGEALREFCKRVLEEMP